MDVLNLYLKRSKKSSRSLASRKIFRRSIPLIMIWWTISGTSTRANLGRALAPITSHHRLSPESLKGIPLLQKNLASEATRSLGSLLVGLMRPKIRDRRFDTHEDRGDHKHPDIVLDEVGEIRSDDHPNPWLYGPRPTKRISPSLRSYSLIVRF